MFNVGIIAAGRSGPLVKLTDRLMEYVPNLEWQRMRFEGNGGLSTATGQIVSGEWHTKPAIGVGAGYEVRATRVAGNAYPMSGVEELYQGSWRSLSGFGGNLYFTVDLEGSNPANYGGRWLIEIRDTATLSVVASARWWTHRNFAP